MLPPDATDGQRLERLTQQTLGRFGRGLGDLAGFGRFWQVGKNMNYENMI